MSNNSSLKYKVGDFVMYGGYSNKFQIINILPDYSLFQYIIKVDNIVSLYVFEKELTPACSMIKNINESSDGFAGKYIPAPLKHKVGDLVIHKNYPNCRAQVTKVLRPEALFQYVVIVAKEDKSFVLSACESELTSACRVKNEFDWSQPNGEQPDIKVDPNLPVGKPIIPVKCDCGCDLLYGEGNTFHSPWCPKYEKQ